MFVKDLVTFLNKSLFFLKGENSMGTWAFITNEPGQNTLVGKGNNKSKMQEEKKCY